MLADDHVVEVAIEHCTAQRPSFSLKGSAAAYDEHVSSVMSALEDQFAAIANAGAIQLVLNSPAGRAPQPRLTDSVPPIPGVRIRPATEWKPRIGSFEVAFALKSAGRTVGGAEVFSKLKTTKFPNPSKLAADVYARVQALLERDEHVEKAATSVAHGRVAAPGGGGGCGGPEGRAADEGVAAQPTGASGNGTPTAAPAHSEARASPSTRAAAAPAEAGAARPAAAVEVEAREPRAAAAPASASDASRPRGMAPPELVSGAPAAVVARAGHGGGGHDGADGGDGDGSASGAINGVVPTSVRAAANGAPAAAEPALAGAPAQLAASEARPMGAPADVHGAPEGAPPPRAHESAGTAQGSAEQQEQQHTLALVADGGRGGVPTVAAGGVPSPAAPAAAPATSSPASAGIEPGA